MDYPELIAELTHRTGDTSIPARARMFLDLAEAEINKVLRVAENETEDTLTTDAGGEAFLPDDFVEMRLAVANGYEGTAIPFPEAAIDPAQRFYNWGYAVKGGKLLTTEPDTDITLYYYAQIPSIALTGTNLIIQTDPEIYIYAMLRQIFAASLDGERARVAESAFRELVRAKIRSDTLARFSQQPFRVAGVIV